MGRREQRVGKRRHVGGGLLEVGDKVGAAVGHAGVVEEPLLPLHDTAQHNAVGRRPYLVDSGEEVVAVEPVELVAVHVVGEQLEAVGGAVGRGNLGGLALGTFEQLAVGGMLQHAERVVDVDAHRRGAGMQRLTLALVGGVGEGQHQEDDGGDTRRHQQPTTQPRLLPRGLLQHLQLIHIAEIDLAVAPQVEEVHHDGHRHSQEANQIKWMSKEHFEGLWVRGYWLLSIKDYTNWSYWTY